MYFKSFSCPISELGYSTEDVLNWIVELFNSKFVVVKPSISKSYSEDTTHWIHILNRFWNMEFIIEHRWKSVEEICWLIVNKLLLRDDETEELYYETQRAYMNFKDRFIKNT